MGRIEDTADACSLDDVKQRFRQGNGTEWITVVGVVGDVKHNGITGQVKTKFYRPYSQYHRGGNIQRGGTLVVRTSAAPLSLAAAVKGAVRELDANIPVAGVRTMEDIVATSITTPRLTSSVLVAFAAVALAKYGQCLAQRVFGLRVFLLLLECSPQGKQAPGGL